MSPSEVWTGHRRMMCALGKIRSRYFRAGELGMYCASQEIFTAIRMKPNLLIAPSLEKEGEFAYASKKEDKTTERRRRTTFGRIVTRQLGLELPDHEVSQISAKLIAMLWQESDGVQEYSGDALVRAYEMLEEHNGSCMTGEGCIYTTLYANNPDKVRLLVMYQDRIPAIRALLWTLEEGNFLDRIYGYQPERLAEWAKNKYDAEKIFRNRKTISVELTFPASGDVYVPYMDSFTTFDGQPSNGETSTFYTDGSGEYTAQFTDGSYEDGRVSCEHCGDRMDSDDAINVMGSSWCSYCVDNHAVQCEDCREYIPSRRAVTVDGNEYCRGCVPRHDECCYCSENFTDCTELKNGDMMCESCLEDEAQECDECGEYVRTGDLYNHEDRSLCEQCLDEAKGKDEPEVKNPEAEIQPDKKEEEQFKLALQIVEQRSCCYVTCNPMLGTEQKVKCPLNGGKFDCSSGLGRIMAMRYVIAHKPSILPNNLIEAFQLLTDYDETNQGKGFDAIRPTILEYIENVDKVGEPAETLFDEVISAVGAGSPPRLVLIPTTDSIKFHPPEKHYISSVNNPIDDGWIIPASNAYWTGHCIGMRLAVSPETILTRKA